MTDEYVSFSSGDDSIEEDEQFDDSNASDLETYLENVDLSSDELWEEADEPEDGAEAPQRAAGKPKPEARVPNLQQSASLTEYLRDELYTDDPDRIAQAIEQAVNTKVQTALSNFMELQAALEPDPNEAMAKRLVTQALATNPEVAQDPHLLTRARIIAAVTNSEDPREGLRQILHKIAPGRGRVEAAAPSEKAPKGGTRAPGRAPRRTNNSSPANALAAKYGLPEDYIKRLELKE